jgi:hypothetical protein
MAFKTGTAPNKCLDIPYSNQASGTALWQWDCNGTPAQEFSLVILRQNIYNIRTIVGLCWTINEIDGDTSAGASVVLENCDGNDRQAFGFFNNGTIRPSYDPTLCFDISNNSSDNGASLILYWCNGGANQQFDVFAQAAHESPPPYRSSNPDRINVNGNDLVNTATKWG